MPTNNPKISAYVPQHIFDRFKDFYEERQISMSQAVAVILSEYFQLEGQANHDSDLPSGLLADRLTALEEKVVSLNSYQSEMIGEVLSEFRNLTSRVDDLEEILDLDNRIPKQSKGKAQQLNLLEPDHQSNHNEVIDSSDSNSSLLSKPPSELIDISAFQPLAGKFLVLRLNVTEGKLSERRKMDDNAFHDWSKKSDLDGIQWVKHQPRGYVPAADTPSELLDKLLTWRIQNNIL